MKIVVWRFCWLGGMVIALSLLPPVTLAQEPLYLHVVVSNRVSLEIPAHWWHLGEADRQNVAAATEGAAKRAGIVSGPTHVASLAVNSTPAPSAALVRVSMVSIDGLTQSELRQDIRERPEQTLAEFQSVADELYEQMAAVLKQQGGQLLSTSPARFEQISGKTAVVFEYRRSSITGPGAFQVRQFHVPVGTSKVIVTLSMRESDAIVYRPILEYVKSTIRIQ